MKYVPSSGQEVRVFDSRTQDVRIYDRNSEDCRVYDRGKQGCRIFDREREDCFVIDINPKHQTFGPAEEILYRLPLIEAWKRHLLGGSGATAAVLAVFFGLEQYKRIGETTEELLEIGAICLSFVVAWAVGYVISTMVVMDIPWKLFVTAFVVVLAVITGIDSFVLGAIG